MFKSADLSTFAQNERLQYFDDMHTKEDIERMIDYAREEGGEKRSIAIVKNMLAAGCTVEFIAQVTGLSPEAIQALQKK